VKHESSFTNIVHAWIQLFFCSDLACITQLSACAATQQ